MLPILKFKHLALAGSVKLSVLPILLLLSIGLSTPGCSAATYQSTLDAERISTGIVAYDEMLTSIEDSLVARRGLFEERTWLAIETVIDDVHGVRGSAMAVKRATTPEAEDAAAEQLSDWIGRLYVDYEVAYLEVGAAFRDLPPQLQKDLKTFHLQAVLLRRSLIPDERDAVPLTQKAENALYWAHQAARLLNAVSSPPPV